MRSPESLSESSLSACFRLLTGFGFFAAAFTSASESLESKEGTLLALVDEGLGLEKASAMDGCFTAKRQDHRVQLWTSRLPADGPQCEPEVLSAGLI